MLDIVSECTLSCSGSGGDQKAAASTLISTAQRIASQLSPNTPAPTPASTPQANFLNLPNINLQGILGGLPGGNNGVNLLVVPPHGPYVLPCCRVHYLHSGTCPHSLGSCSVHTNAAKEVHVLGPA